MSRSLGELEPIQEFIPDWLAPVIALLTQLGDIWFLVLLLAVLYWTQVERQDDVILVGGMLAAGIGVYRSLKFIFELPRPNEPLLDPELVPWLIRPLYELTAFSGSYGFPSGHATVATIVYFGLATIFPIGSRKLRYGIAGGFVALIGFTRMALGLHFLVDIVVGAALGGTVLYIGFRGASVLSQDQNTILLFGALLCNTVYLFASNIDIEAVIMFGAALGLFGGWQLVELARALGSVGRPSRTVKPLLLRGGLAILSLGPLVAALEFIPLFTGELAAAAGVTGVVIAVLVIVPIARYSSRVRQLLGAISFWTTAILDGFRTLLRRLA